MISKTAWFEYEYMSKHTKGWVRTTFSLAPTTERQAQAALRFQAAKWPPDVELRLVRVEVKETFEKAIRGGKK